MLERDISRMPSPEAVRQGGVGKIGNSFGWPCSQDEHLADKVPIGGFGLVGTRKPKAKISM